MVDVLHPNYGGRRVLEITTITKILSAAVVVSLLAISPMVFSESSFDETSGIDPGHVDAIEADVFIPGQYIVVLKQSVTKEVKSSAP